MPDLLSTAEFEQHVVKVSERLEGLRGATRQAHVTGSVPYAGTDLTDILPDLAAVLATLIRQDPEEPITNNARLEVGGRRLALAAICSLLLQGDGLSDFPARYKALMGKEPEWDLFERLLPTAMREAGLPIPGRTDPKALLESLLVAAGLPKGLLIAACEYFVIYWRWFHPCEEPLAPLQDESLRQGLPPAAVSLLETLAPRLLPNAGVVVPFIQQLCDLMVGLRTQPRWRLDDAFTQPDLILNWTGIEPKKLLQGDEEALRILKEGLSKAWHPSQFQRVLASFPRGAEVRLPSGSLAMVDKCFGVPQWGVYRIEHKVYLVSPNEGLDLSDLAALPNQGRVGSQFVCRSADEVAITWDEWPSLERGRALFDDKQAGGWLFVAPWRPGVRVSVEGRSVACREGVHWGSTLALETLAEVGPRLAVRVRGLKVCLPEYAGMTVQLECPQAETSGRLTFELSADGMGELPDQALLLTTPEPGHVDLVLQDHATGSELAHAGRALRRRLPLPEMALMGEADAGFTPPSEAPRMFGCGSYILFSTRPVNTGAMQMRDIGVTALGRQGGYELHRLTWLEGTAPLEIYVDGRHQWNFDYRIEGVWQTSDMPSAPAPLVFAPESPSGLTVATVDSLFVDDVCLLDGALVTLERDGVALFSLTWAELNWLMNFPAENRRLSGAMVRRALDAPPEHDFAGRYTLAMRAAGRSLGRRDLLVLPQLDLAVSPKGLVDEEAVYTISAKASVPCFPGGLRQMDLLLGRPIVDRDAMENPPFAPRPLEGKLRFAVPSVEVPVSVVPDVGGFRLLDDQEGSWVRKTVLGHEELDHLTLVLFAAGGQNGSLQAGSQPPLLEEFYEGFATFPLGSLSGSLTHHETDLEVCIDGRSFGTLSVVWHPRIQRFEAASEYLIDGVAVLDIAADGPEDVPIRLEAFAPDGTRLTKLDVDTDGSLDRQISLVIPGSKDHPVVTVKAFVPTLQGGMAAGTVEVRNPAFEPEIEELNNRIAADPKAAELRYERAQLLVARGLRKAAARDFQAAIDLGMSELLDSPQYQQFLSQRRAEGFHEDLKAIACFFVPFARKELSIG
ncbi:MAG: hypothetical protein VKP62_00920 [Candidatus Sericytochromatia bacterium]|nr:hypothetical protein [Candidatus Sericytochromatia bacterium]